MKSVLKSIISATSVVVFASGCPFMCFVAGTRVWTQDGPKAIESLQVGDRVWSWDTGASKPVLRAVTQLIQGESFSTRRIVAGEQVLAGVTDEHPFYNPFRREWVKARELEVGDAVLCWQGAHEAKVVGIETCETRASDSGVAVYTLTVQGPEHNYFAEGFLVHNKSIGGPHSEPAIGTCVEALDSVSSLDFGEVAVGETGSLEVWLTSPEDSLCEGVLKDFTVTLDDPDGAFELPDDLADLDFGDLMTADQGVEITFGPPGEGPFEAQLLVEVTLHTTDDAQTDVRVQLFGTGAVAAGEQ